MPYILIVGDPDRSRAVDWVQIGRLEQAGVVDPLGAGYYAVEPPLGWDDVVDVLVPCPLRGIRHTCSLPASIRPCCKTVDVP